jgi:hypothetical protein
MYITFSKESLKHSDEVYITSAIVQSYPLFALSSIDKLLSLVIEHSLSNRNRIKLIQ